MKKNKIAEWLASMGRVSNLTSFLLVLFFGISFSYSENIYAGYASGGVDSCGKNKKFLTVSGLQLNDRVLDNYLDDVSAKSRQYSAAINKPDKTGVSWAANSFKCLVEDLYFFAVWNGKSFDPLKGNVVASEKSIFPVYLCFRKECQQSKHIKAERYILGKSKSNCRKEEVIKLKNYNRISVMVSRCPINNDIYGRASTLYSVYYDSRKDNYPSRVPCYSIEYPLMLGKISKNKLQDLKLSRGSCLPYYEAKLYPVYFAGGNISSPFGVEELVDLDVFFGALDSLAVSLIGG